MGGCIVGREYKSKMEFSPYKIILFISSKLECEELKKAIIRINRAIGDRKIKLTDKFHLDYRTLPENIHSFGDISNVSGDYLRKMIPHGTTIITSEDNVNKKEIKEVFKCYIDNCGIEEQIIREKRSKLGLTG